MNDRLDPRNAGDDEQPGREQDGNTIAPLPGEPGIPNVAARPGGTVSKKGLLAVSLLIFLASWLF